LRERDVVRKNRGKRESIDSSPSNLSLSSMEKSSLVKVGHCLLAVQRETLEGGISQSERSSRESQPRRREREREREKERKRQKKEIVAFFFFLSLADDFFRLSKLLDDLISRRLSPCSLSLFLRAQGQNGASDRLLLLGGRRIIPAAFWTRDRRARRGSQKAEGERALEPSLSLFASLLLSMWRLGAKEKRAAASAFARPVRALSDPSFGFSYRPMASTAEARFEGPVDGEREGKRDDANG
jgi:hypothetical protein